MAPTLLTFRDWRWSIALFLDAQPPRWSGRFVSIAVVALGLFDSGDAAGAAEAIRAFLASMSDGITRRDQPVQVFASIARRLAEFGDREGAESALAMMQRFLPRTTGAPALAADRYGLADAAFSTADFRVEALVRLYGFEATWTIIEQVNAAQPARLYCGAIRWGIHTGLALDEALRRSQASANLCRSELAKALASIRRYGDLLRLLSSADAPLTQADIGYLGRSLVDAPPSADAAAISERLLERCAQTGYSVGRDPPVWPLLLVALARQPGGAAGLERGIARLDGADVNWGHLAWAGGLADHAWQASPAAMDLLVTALGNRVPEPVSLHARAAARAYAGDIPGALELVPRIRAQDQRILALVRITAAAWRREHGEVLESRFPYS